jgi:hypothetical protein
MRGGGRLPGDTGHRLLDRPRIAPGQGWARRSGGVSGAQWPLTGGRAAVGDGLGFQSETPKHVRVGDSTRCPRPQLLVPGSTQWAKI